MSSTTKTDLERRRDALLREAANAAAAADSATLYKVTQELRTTESLLAALEHAERAAAVFLSGDARVAPATPLVALAERGGPSTAGREIGGRVREDFLERARATGVTLHPYRGAVYRASAGERVGTAVATERNRNRWFLGLGEDAFDSAVLLCVADDGRTYDICLPAEFFALHGAQMSRAGGQIKFNVARRGPNLVLKIPRRDPVVVDRYLCAYSGLIASGGR